MSLCSSQAPRKRDSAWSWLVCFSGALSLALIFAFTQCFAIVMPLFTEIFKESKSKTAWAGSITMGLTFFAMPLSTTFINRTSIRTGGVVGGLMCATSLIISSFSQSLLQIFFSYSILYGLGTSLLFCSNIVAVSKYFDKREAAAVGLLVAGQNIGALSLGPIIQILLDLYGLSWMYRIIAASFLLPIVLIIVTYDPNVETRTNRHANDGELEEFKQLGFTCSNIIKVFKTPAYLIALASLTLQCLACFTSYVHLISYCLEVNIEAQKASRLFIFIGVSSLVSCVVCGRILDMKRVNPFHVSQIGALSMGLSMLLLQLATHYYHFIIYSVFLGLGLGTFFTTVIVLLLRTVDVRLSLISLSIGQSITSMGNTLGPPLIGFIADVQGSYKPAFFTAGGILLLGFVTPFLQYCFKPWRKQSTNHLSVEVKHDVTYEVANGVESNGIRKENPINEGESEGIALKNLNGDLTESYINESCISETAGKKKKDVEENNEETHHGYNDIKDAIPGTQVEVDEGETKMSNNTQFSCMNEGFDSKDVEANATNGWKDAITSEDAKDDFNTKL